MVKISYKKDRRRKQKLGTEWLLYLFLIASGIMIVCNFMLSDQSSTASGSTTQTEQQPTQQQSQTQSKNGENKRKATTNTKTTTTKENNKTKREPTMHIIFSTSCHIKQDWQSYLFFFQAMVHQQPGTVTRIASGCSHDEEMALQKVHEEQIKIMNPNFFVHFTPQFGKVPGANWQLTKYWNKPFGVKHWLENVFGYRYEGDISTEYDDDIVVLVDPDMLMQRPFINDFSNYPNEVWNRYARNHPDDLYFQVTHGKPMAQDYNFGTSWIDAAVKTRNLTYVVGPDSLAHEVDRDRLVARGRYPAGPPYILTARDMYRVAYNWADILPRLFHVHGVFMDEMNAYCMAAAHLGLPHQLARGFMISNVGISEGEGWFFMDHVQPEDACQFQKLADAVPQVIHFCQRYSIGKYFLSKYKLPKDMLACESPLFELPPPEIGAQVNYSRYGDGSTTEWPARSTYLKLRNTFMVCSLMSSLNDAMKFFKDHNCPDGNANYEENWNTLEHLAQEEAAKDALKQKKISN